MYTLEEGSRLVKLARQAIEARYSNNQLILEEETKKDFSAISGCFVTLQKHGQLRGCIGFPEPDAPLFETLISVAENVTYRDTRFPPVLKEEIPDLCIEVNILTRPTLIEAKKTEDYLDQIQIGKDGLILRSAFAVGLLLPEVAPRYGWDSKTFLKQTCIKAGLNPDAWKDVEQVKIFKFQSQAFAEKTPIGEIIQVL